MKFSTTYAQAYLTQQEYDAYATRHADALAIVDRNAYESDMLGWVDIDEWANADLCSQIKTLAAEIREKADVFVVVGLGGSNQAARAVIDALTPQDTANGGPEILYAALNLSGAYYNNLVKQLDGKSVYIDVIAKNFKTLEPGLTFRMLRHYLEDRYGKEEAARREKALSRAGIPRRYWAAEADRPEFAEYIASFAGNGGAGLYIHGGVGAGKTHAASAMARLFAEAGYDVAFTTAKGMLERVKATFDEGGTEAAVARYAKCDVLVLDDLGKEDATEWSVGTVFSVLDARYEDMRPTIVTSNYAPGALADRLARRGERVTAEAIASRISQTCRPVYLGGRDRRRRG